MSTYIDYAVCSMASPRHNENLRENQDNYLIIDNGRVEFLYEGRVMQSVLENWPCGHARLAVVDGVGGHGGGREIAERIVQEIAMMPAFTSQHEMEAALEKLHHQVRSEFSGQQAQPPGATLLLIEIPPAPSAAMLFHVGDSRLFALRPQAGLELLTADQTPATVKAVEGKLNRGEWLQHVLHENNRMIIQAFGMGHADGQGWRKNLQTYDQQTMPEYLAHLADRRLIVLEPGIRYLLATDGLWAYRRPWDFLTQIAALGKNSDMALPQLARHIELAHCQASQGESHVDNTTFIVFALPPQQDRSILA